MLKIRVLIPVVVLVIAVFLLSWRTNGFKAFTIYSYELEKASPVGRHLPDSLFILTDNGSRVKLISEVKGHYTLLSIVFLKCTNTCPIITGKLSELHQGLSLKEAAIPVGKGIADDQNASVPVHRKLQLMTLSFDGRRDDLKDIREYKDMYVDMSMPADNNMPSGTREDPMPEMDSHKGQDWVFAVIDSKSEAFIKRNLSFMGFWFYEITPGMYNHSPYLYLVDPDGVIKNVYDPGKLSDQQLIDKIVSDIN